ncbi:PREDICTED: uncharacterized protein LOC108560825 [Nicrophorus vespilloides]|uniref:Uncharacterized protein LOC108560825 n=1 Tax=Nicrophorus vespilloides TaxID=110193 RepID=A0ABM1MHG1_NICVS|nr:PREDICTED: uncharacterized protein LOC108560825 [Nicrophorus vespilloides]
MASNTPPGPQPPVSREHWGRKSSEKTYPRCRYDKLRGKTFGRFRHLAYHVLRPDTMSHQKNKFKVRVIPQQDKRICATICLCQLMIVFSGVSLIYLTVAVYIPAYKAFYSGYEERPVMCQTINTSVNNNCSWASCGEWCLTKTSGFCPQVHVTTRQNGTTMQLQDCTEFMSVSCPDVVTSKLRRYNCNNGSECSNLSGVFNCTLGHCSNLSEVYQCHHKADGHVLDSDKDNMKMTGFFECRGSRCTKIKRPFTCDRYCDHINSSDINVIITIEDTLYTARCSEAIATTIANGNEPETKIDPTVFWKEDPRYIMMTSCNTLVRNESIIEGTDCLNGTIYKKEDIPGPTMNFTTFWSLRPKALRPVDPRQRFIPPQSTLTIYNSSKLLINIDGCVNTLRGECREFMNINGRDGRNQTAQSRFPCYYKKNMPATVLLRFDLNETRKYLIIAAVLPSTIFVVSFVTLCVIMRCVKVGDDAKMRCILCTETPESESEMTAISRFDDLSPYEGPPKKDETPLVN